MTPNALTVMQPQASALSRELMVSLSERARDYAAAGMADNTKRAYGGDWRDFDEWCASAGLNPLPADAPTLALYLSAKAPLVSTATLARRLAAIRAAHRAAGFPVPDSGALSAVWSGIRRSHGRPPRPKRALMVEDVRRVARALSDDTAGLRDRALILVGFAAALRRSELAGMEVDGPAAGPVRAVFVAGGLEVHIDRSKADQEGLGAVVAVPFGAHPETCPVLALQAWIKAAKIEAGPIFRGVDRWGRIGATAITPHAVALVVKSAADRIGLAPEGFAGHSLRAGLATSAAINDAPAHLIQKHLRHARQDTTTRYIREGERFKRNAAGMVGL
jgi:integrase